jgi:hypothetical protein
MNAAQQQWLRYHLQQLLLLLSMHCCHHGQSSSC